MKMNESKKMPANKQALMDGRNYEVFNRDLTRKVFPRIISEFKAVRPRVQVGDIIPFYFTLLSYVDGKEFLSDGVTPNKSYGAAFPPQSDIQAITGIGTRRQKWLAEVLRQNGLLFRYEEKYENLRRYTFYYPSYCPIINDDGYVVNADTGEIYRQDVADLLHELDYVNRWS